MRLPGPSLRVHRPHPEDAPPGAAPVPAGTAFQAIGTNAHDPWYLWVWTARAIRTTLGVRSQEDRMPVHVDVFIPGGMASGQVAREGHLRDVLEGGGLLALERASWQPTSEVKARAVGVMTIAIDDILVAFGDDEPMVPVHASWHPIRLEMGPYVVEGELPTLPGYDPGRALTRPNGEFLLLREVRLGWLGGAVGTSPVGHVAHINRYGVERVTADLMLGFYFPGAALGMLDAKGADSAPVAAALGALGA